MSNCVINLSDDKEKALAEAYRELERKRFIYTLTGVKLIRGLLKKHFMC